MMGAGQGVGVGSKWRGSISKDREYEHVPGTAPWKWSEPEEACYLAICLV